MTVCGTVFDSSLGGHAHPRQMSDFAQSKNDAEYQKEAMTGKTVWVSRAMMDTTLVKGFASDVAEVDKTAAVEAMKASGKGLPLPEERFPKKMYGKYPDERKKRQPNLFMAGGFWTVSEEFADVLRRFDLGQTGLYPVDLFQHDRVTPVEGTYFCLAFGETKECFQPDASPNARVPSYPPKEPYWRLPAAPKDYDFALISNALVGVDLWIDPKVYDAFFLSNQLVEALKAAKLTRRLGLTRCRLLASH